MKPLFRLYSFAFAFALAAFAIALPALADAPTLPPTGVSLAEYIPVVIAGLTATLVAVVGMYFGFQLLVMGLNWFSSVGKRRR